MKRLIVNADDYNLTQNTSRAILKAHDQGVVSSTSVMVNLPISLFQRNELNKRHALGVGLHLNLTLGRPISNLSQSSGLIDHSGFFLKPMQKLARHLTLSALQLELTAQLNYFRKIFGKHPDHLDTHHHIHQRSDVAQAVTLIAVRFGIPLRRAAELKSCKLFHKLRTTDYFFGSLSPKRHWTSMSLKMVLTHLPNGISEIMCHPSLVDRDLRRLSSFQEGREVEFRIFSERSLRRLLREHGILLCNFKTLLVL